MSERDKASPDHFGLFPPIIAMSMAFWFVVR